MQFEQYENSIDDIHYYQKPRPHDHYFAGVAIGVALEKGNPRPDIESIENREMREEVEHLIECFKKNDGVDTNVMNKALRYHGGLFFGACCHFS